MNIVVENLVAMLEEAERKKWDKSMPRDRREYYQGKADACRQLILLMKEHSDDYIKYRAMLKEAERGAQTGRGTCISPLCPKCRCAMDFIAQTEFSTRLFRCLKCDTGWIRKTPKKAPETKEERLLQVDPSSSVY